MHYSSTPSLGTSLDRHPTSRHLACLWQTLASPRLGNRAVRMAGPARFVVKDGERRDNPPISNVILVGQGRT